MPIAKRILSTLGSLLLTLLRLSVLTFFIGRNMPTDPVLAMVGDNAPEYVVQRAREEMGLNQPLWVQFGRYLWQLLHGDLGNSILTSNPVMTEIARFFPATLELATAAIIIAALVGIPLGVWAAVRQSTWVDQTIPRALVDVLSAGISGFGKPVGTAFCSHLCEQVGVMQQGEMVEILSAEQLRAGQIQHPHTAELYALSIALEEPA